MHHGEHSRGRAIGLALLIVAAFALVVVGIHLLSPLLDDQPLPQERGDLEARFAPSLTVEVGDRVWAYRERDLETVLLMGVDTEDINAVTTGYRGGGQSDFLLLLVLDKTTETVTPIQLDRDTMTPVKVYGVLGNYTGVRVTQLTLAHAMGRTESERADNTIWAVSNLLMNIPIDHYAAFDFNSIPLLNDAVGGVTVTIPEDLTAANPAFVEGATITLMGEEAVQFVRSRREVSDGHNTSRMVRQRLYMDAALAQIKQKIASDRTYAENLLTALDTHLASDMGLGQLVGIMLQASQYQWNDFVTMEGEHVISESTGYMTFTPDPDRLQEMTLKTFFELYK